MGSYTPELTLPAIEFDGDKIVFTIGRMQNADMGKFSKFIDREKGVIRFEDAAELAALAADVLPRYVRRMEGMFRPDGTAWLLEEWVKECGALWFAPLVGRLLTELVLNSTLRKEEAKN